MTFLLPSDSLLLRQPHTASVGVCGEEAKWQQFLLALDSSSLSGFFGLTAWFHVHFPRQPKEEQLGSSWDTFWQKVSSHLCTASSNFQSLISSTLCLPQSSQESRQHDYQPISQMGRLRHRCESTHPSPWRSWWSPSGQWAPSFLQWDGAWSVQLCSPNTKSGPGLDVSSRPLASFHLFPQVSEEQLSSLSTQKHPDCLWTPEWK